MFKKLLLLIVSIFLLVGCGSSGGESDDTVNTNDKETKVGVFLDSAVEGVKYKTSSGIEGFTNDNGEYDYQIGDTVEFFIGDISLGNKVATEKITVFDLKDSSKLAQFLQTFDEDSIPDNGIKITKQVFTTMLDENIPSSLTINDFNSETQDTISFVEDVVKIAVLSDRTIPSKNDALIHASKAIIEDKLNSNNSKFIKYLRGNQNFSNIDFESNILKKSAKARMYLYAYDYLTNPLIQLEHNTFDNNIKKIDDIKNIIETTETIVSSIQDLSKISNGLSSISGEGLVSGSIGLYNTLEGETVNLFIEDDSSTAIYAGLSAMRSCAINAVTTLTLKACISSAINSAQTFAFSGLINMTTERNNELEIANKYLRSLAVCGGESICMWNKYSDGNYISSTDIVKILIGKTTWTTNDPDVEDVLNHIYKFNLLSDRFVNDIENIFGDLSNYNTDFIVTSYIKQDIKNILIKEYSDDSADISYKLIVEDKGASINIQTIKVKINDIIIRTINDIDTFNSREIQKFQFIDSIPDWENIKIQDYAKLSIEIQYNISNGDSTITDKKTIDLNINYIKAELENSIDGLNIYLEKENITAVEETDVYFKAIDSGRIDLPDIQEPYTIINIEQVQGVTVDIKDADTFMYKFKAPSIPADNKNLNLVFKLTTKDTNTNVVSKPVFLNVTIVKKENFIKNTGGLKVEFPTNIMDIKPNVNYTIKASIINNSNLISDLNYNWSFDPNNNDIEIISGGLGDFVTLKFKENNTSFDKKYRIMLNIDGSNNNFEKDSDSNFIDVILEKNKIIDEPFFDITAPIFKSQNTVSVNENQTSALTVVASDDSTLTYTLSGTNANGFNINSTSGTITFKTAPDYETKTSYTLTVTATDSSDNNVSQDITITILDIDETVADTTPPTLSHTNHTYTTAVGTVLLLQTVTATDNIDGSVNVTQGGTVDFDTVGTYSVTYTATDSSANSSSITHIYKVNTITTSNIEHNGYEYGTITSATTGKVWLDRNLGASQVCTSFDDSECYGDYYQWGRLTDGHEKSDSSTITTQATDISNAGVNFITSSDTYDYDWAHSVDSGGNLRSVQWSKTDGSSVCPIGYRVPTLREFKAETIDEDVTNNVTAFSNFLKLPSAGARNYSSSSLYNQGSSSHIWSLSVSEFLSSNMYFDSNNAFSEESGRGYGLPVRCIEASSDTTAPTLSHTNHTYTTTVGTALTLPTVTATDDIDGSVSVTKGEDTVDFNTVGTYSVTYTATDSSANSSTITHTYTVNAVAITTTITHNGITYGTITSPYTGKVWLDRNLGASQVCTSFNDNNCYGDYYQWGRNTDGHEKSTNTTTTEIRATSVNNVGHNKFITNSDWSENDWTSIDSDGSIRKSQWSSTDGSSVCPIHYRVPTIEELKLETLDNNINTNIQIFNSFLKIAFSGNRFVDAEIYYKNTDVFIWSSSVTGSSNNHPASQILRYLNGTGSSNSNLRTAAIPIRCIKD